MDRVGGADDPVPVRWLDWRAAAVWIMVTAAVSLTLGWAMHRLTDAALPYADAGITGASVAAQFLLAFRRIENWLLWIVIDVVAIALYIDRVLYLTAGLYAAFLVLSVIGLREWIAAEQRARAAVARVIRVCFHGAESTGKSTLASKLGAEFGLPAGRRIRPHLCRRRTTPISRSPTCSPSPAAGPADARGAARAIRRWCCSTPIR